MKEKIYHYTKIRDKAVNVLESIIRKDAIHLHSFFFVNMRKMTICGLKIWSQEEYKKFLQDNQSCNNY